MHSQGLFTAHFAANNPYNRRNARVARAQWVTDRWIDGSHLPTEILPRIPLPPPGHLALNLVRATEFIRVRGRSGARPPFLRQRGLRHFQAHRTRCSEVSLSLLQTFS